MEESKLSDREKSRITTEKCLDYVPDSRGLGYEFFHSMVVNRNEVAQVNPETGEIDTYGDLLLRCVRTTVNLLYMGVTKDDILCVCTHNHFNSCVPIICALFLGIKVAPLDPSLFVEEITYYFAKIRPRIVFASPDAVHSVSAALYDVGIECNVVVFGSSDSEEIIEFEIFLEEIVCECDFTPLPIADIKDTAVILYSGGTAKAPRGVCLSHYTLMMQLVNTAICWNVGKKLHLSNYSKEKSGNGNMVLMGFSNYYWISAFEILICSVMTGTARVICKEFEPTAVWKTIDKYKVSLISCSTYEATQLYKLDKPEGADGKSLQMLVTGGVHFSKNDLLELRKLFPRCFITNAYRQLEAAGFVTMYNFMKPADIRDQYQKPKSCGKLVPGFSCKIVDPVTEKSLNPNQPGELRYKTELVISNYHRLIGTVNVDQNGWIKTGDVAFYDERRCIYVLDPLDEVFKYKCWHILPSVVERVIKEHIAVKDAVVIGIPQKNLDLGEMPMAIVSLKKGMTNRVTAEDLEKYANAWLKKKQKIRAGVKIVRDIPLTPLGKPDRKMLKKLMMNEFFCELVYEECECQAAFIRFSVAFL